MSALRSATLQLRSARYALRTRGLSLRGAVTPLDPRMVFVVGSPRSGTTFLAGAIGSCPGFADLGEVAALKAAIPALAKEPPELAAPKIRRILSVARRLALAGGVRAVEQTPETAFVAGAVLAAFPQAQLVHIVRDGRDVVCSLLERGWLSAGRGGADDAGSAYGRHARFWVEPGREAEFEAASDATRAAWAWRRYVEAARGSGAPCVELRYEDLARDPHAAASLLAERLGAPRRELESALAAVHASSVGRYRRDLGPAELADVEREAGPLLRELGYLQ